MEFNRIIYKERYYLSKFINEINLFKIVEIITVCKNYDTHYESYLVTDDKNILNISNIYSADDFSGPPINVTNVAT